MIVLNDDRKMGKEIVQVSYYPFLYDLVAAGDISKGKVMWLILLTIAQVRLYSWAGHKRKR